MRVVIDGIKYEPVTVERNGVVVFPPDTFRGADEGAVGDAIFEWLNHEVAFGIWKQVRQRFVSLE